MAMGYQITAPIAGAVKTGMSLANTTRAVYEAGQRLQAEWAKLARSSIGERSGKYIQGIEAEGALEHPYDGDSLSVAIFNRAEHAWIIEEGSEAFNLAARIKWGGPRHRRSKSTNRWFIRVPFRHYTVPKAGEGGTRARGASAMPPAIHKLAKGMQHKIERLTFRQGAAVAETVHEVVHGRHGVIAVRGHGPGNERLGVKPGRLTEVKSPGLLRAHGHPRLKTAASHSAAVSHAHKHGLARPSERHVSPLHEGMRKSGSAGHSQYMTFRVLHEDSVWMIPARAGKFLARNTMLAHRKLVADLISEGFRRDVEAAISTALGGSA